MVSNNKHFQIDPKATGTKPNRTYDGALNNQANRGFSQSFHDADSANTFNKAASKPQTQPQSGSLFDAAIPSTTAPRTPQQQTTDWNKPQRSHRSATSRPARFANRSKKRVGLKNPDSVVIEMPMNTATVFSSILHVGVPAALALLFVIVAILLSLLANIDIWKWLQPPERPKDIEFVLAPDTQSKRPDKASFKAEFNQQAGGENDPNKKITPPETPQQQAVASQATPPTQKPTPAVKPSPQRPAVKPQPKATPPQPQTKQAQQKPTPPTPKFKPTIATKKIASAAAPSPKAPVATSSPSASASNASSASPMQIPNASNLAKAAPSSFGRTSSGVGNPEGGQNAPGVNAIADVDFGPYMADLKRRIKRNWHPPRAGRSNDIILEFLLARDGRLLSIQMKKTSGYAENDEAAISAVKLSAPFRPFPAGVTDDTLPIDFTFDYNVLKSQ